MTLEQVVNLFKEKPYLMKKGRGELGRRLNINPNLVPKAKELARRKVRPPKILLFDLETAPMKAYVFSLWKQNIAWDHTLSQWYILAWSAKWLYSSETYSAHLTSEEAKNEDDSRILRSLWDLIDEADIVVTHNGNRADIPWMNTRFILNGLRPPTPYFSVDTCEVARKCFSFSSNKLDALAEYFGIPHKLDTDFELWKRCTEGDEEALEYMSEYNVKDTQILEEVYLKLRPWIKGHPNCGNFVDSEVPICSICGSTDFVRIPGQYYYTSVGKYSLYRCKKCGAVSRGRKNLRSNSVSTVSVGK